MVGGCVIDEKQCPRGDWLLVRGHLELGDALVGECKPGYGLDLNAKPRAVCEVCGAAPSYGFILD